MSGSCVLQTCYVGSLGAFGARSNFHRYILAFSQNFTAAAVDGGMMDENVLAAFLRDEAETFFSVEPLNRTIY